MKPFFSNKMLPAWQRYTSVLLGVAFIFGVAYFSSCKKENVPLDSTSATGAVTQSRTDGDCANFPELVGVSYQTVRYNSSEQIAEMYGNLVSEADVAAVADHLINLHLTQGQQAALNYMETELDATPEEIALINSFLNQSSQIDFDNLSVDIIEDFANGYRDYLCTTYNTPPTPPIGPINPGDGINNETAQNMLNMGSILVHTAEGGLKGLLDMQNQSGGGVTERSSGCSQCFWTHVIHMAYYMWSGKSFGKTIGFAAGGPPGAVIGAKIGMIAGALYGANKALKSDPCKTCLNRNIENTTVCANPTKITFLPVSCDEVRCRLWGQSNLNSPSFNWFNQNSTPTELTTTVEEQRIIVPNRNNPTEVRCYFKDCDGEEDNVPNSFNLYNDFIDIDENFFSIVPNSTAITAGGYTDIIITPSKVWNDNLYSISYSSDKGYITNVPNTQPSALLRRFSTYSGGPGSGTPTPATITVTITNCLGESVTKTKQITIN